MTDVAVSPFAEALRDRYVLERELGRGGMATVYLARDVKHDRLIALKVIRPELASVLGSERFQREIRVTARLQHPHILSVHDSGEAVGQLWYVMPYVEGESLRDRLRREGQLPLEDALQITYHVLAALSYAHECGIVHRDIKPENILLARGEALVADFGIAQIFNAVTTEQLTETGLAIGTAAYMSPEQAAADRRLDGRSDIYSTSCVLYEMLAGEPPFTGPSAQAIVAKRLSGPIPRLRTLREVSPHVEAAVMRALALAPADRFPSAAAFAAALEQSRTAPVMPTGVAQRSPRLRLRWRQGATAGAAIVGVGLGGWLLSRANGHAGEQRSVAVLPCQTPIQDSLGASLGERWTEELIDKLSRLGDLRPKSWLSVQRYRKTEKHPREVARELGARTLVRCRVTETSAGVQLALQLVRPEDDDVIWSDRYERPLSADAINAVQSEAARAIARALGIAPAESEIPRLERPLSHDLEALRLYRLGRHFSGKLTVEALQKSIDYYRQAIARDSTFAYAYVALAEDLSKVHDANFRPVSEYASEYASLVLKALAIDPSLAEAHTLLATHLFGFSFDWVNAEREYRRAIELNPSSAITRITYAWDLGVVGRFDDAIKHLEKAVELDPADPLARLMLARVLSDAHRDARAIEEARAAVELDPNNPGARYALGSALFFAGQRDSGLAELEMADLLYGNFLASRAWLAYFYAVMGRREPAERMLEVFRTGSAQRPVAPGAMAVLHLGLGNREETLRWLEKDYEQRGFMLLWALGSNRAYDPVRSDPRFQALRRRVGFDNW